MFFFRDLLRCLLHPHMQLLAFSATFPPPLVSFLENFVEELDAARLTQAAGHKKKREEEQQRQRALSFIAAHALAEKGISRREEGICSTKDLAEAYMNGDDFAKKVGKTWAEHKNQGLQEAKQEEKSTGSDARKEGRDGTLSRRLADTEGEEKEVRGTVADSREEDRCPWGGEQAEKGGEGVRARAEEESAPPGAVGDESGRETNGDGAGVCLSERKDSSNHALSPGSSSSALPAGKREEKADGERQSPLHHHAVENNQLRPRSRKGGKEIEEESPSRLHLEPRSFERILLCSSLIIHSGESKKTGEIGEAEKKKERNSGEGRGGDGEQEEEEGKAERREGRVQRGTTAAGQRSAADVARALAKKYGTPSSPTPPPLSTAAVTAAENPCLSSFRRSSLPSSESGRTSSSCGDLPSPSFFPAERRSPIHEATEDVEVEAAAVSGRETRPKKSTQRTETKERREERCCRTEEAKTTSDAHPLRERIKVDRPQENLSLEKKEKRGGDGGHDEALVDDDTRGKDISTERKGSTADYTGEGRNASRSSSSSSSATSFSLGVPPSQRAATRAPTIEDAGGDFWTTGRSLLGDVTPLHAASKTVQRVPPGQSSNHAGRHPENLLLSSPVSSSTTSAHAVSASSPSARPLPSAPPGPLVSNSHGSAPIQAASLEEEEEEERPTGGHPTEGAGSTSQLRGEVPEKKKKSLGPCEEMKRKHEKESSSASVSSSSTSKSLPSPLLEGIFEKQAKTVIAVMETLPSCRRDSTHLSLCVSLSTGLHSTLLHVDVTLVGCPLEGSLLRIETMGLPPPMCFDASIVFSSAVSCPPHRTLHAVPFFPERCK